VYSGVRGVAAIPHSFTPSLLHVIVSTNDRYSTVQLSVTKGRAEVGRTQCKWRPIVRATTGRLFLYSQERSFSVCERRV
jgi:hypothetical protein